MRTIESIKYHQRKHSIQQIMRIILGTYEISNYFVHLFEKKTDINNEWLTCVFVYETAEKYIFGYAFISKKKP